MDQLRDWVKLTAAWLATIGGYMTEHVTMGKVTLVATFILTCLQVYKVWLDIRWRRNREERSGLR